eukprot:gene9237-16387_t
MKARDIPCRWKGSRPAKRGSADAPESHLNMPRVDMMHSRPGIPRSPPHLKAKEAEASLTSAGLVGRTPSDIRAAAAAELNESIGRTVMNSRTGQICLRSSIPGAAATHSQTPSTTSISRISSEPQPPSPAALSLRQTPRAKPTHWQTASPQRSARSGSDLIRKHSSSKGVSPPQAPGTSMFEIYSKSGPPLAGESPQRSGSSLNEHSMRRPGIGATPHVVERSGHSMLEPRSHKSILHFPVPTIEAKGSMSPPSSCSDSMTSSPKRGETPPSAQAMHRAGIHHRLASVGSPLSPSTPGSVHVDGWYMKPRPPSDNLGLTDSTPLSSAGSLSSAGTPNGKVLPHRRLSICGLSPESTSRYNSPRRHTTKDEATAPTPHGSSYNSPRRHTTKEEAAAPYTSPQRHTTKEEVAAPYNSPRMHTTKDEATAPYSSPRRHTTKDEATAHTYHGSSYNSPRRHTTKDEAATPSRGSSATSTPRTAKRAQAPLSRVTSPEASSVDPPARTSRPGSGRDRPGSGRYSAAQALVDAVRSKDDGVLISTLESLSTAAGECAGLNEKHAVAGRTALHEAVLLNNMAMVRCLLKSGGDPNIGHTTMGPPLLHAAAWGEAEMLGLLIDAGADIHACDAAGFTALHLACVGSHVEAGQVLLSRGADLHAQNDDGDEPLDLARSEVGRILTSVGSMSSARHPLRTPPSSGMEAQAGIRPWQEGSNRSGGSIRCPSPPGGVAPPGASVSRLATESSFANPRFSMSLPCLVLSQHMSCPNPPNRFLSRCAAQSPPNSRSPLFSPFSDTEATERGTPSTPPQLELPNTIKRRLSRGANLEDILHVFEEEEEAIVSSAVDFEKDAPSLLPPSKFEPPKAPPNAKPASAQPNAPAKAEPATAPPDTPAKAEPASAPPKANPAPSFGLKPSIELKPDGLARLTSTTSASASPHTPKILFGTQRVAVPAPAPGPEPVGGDKPAELRRTLERSDSSGIGRTIPPSELVMATDGDEERPSRGSSEKPPRPPSTSGSAGGFGFRFGFGGLPVPGFNSGSIVDALPSFGLSPPGEGGSPPFYSPRASLDGEGHAPIRFGIPSPGGKAEGGGHEVAERLWLMMGKNDPVRISQVAQALSKQDGMMHQSTDLLMQKAGVFAGLMKQQKRAMACEGLLLADQRQASWSVKVFAGLNQQTGKMMAVTVFAGLNQQTGELMAVKVLEIITKNGQCSKEVLSQLEELKKELDLYKTLKHRHVVGYIDALFDATTSTLYIFLEFVPGGSIASMLERTVHRDVKGDNILVSRDGIVKLADGMKSIKGSVFWMAPEVIKGTGYGRRADVWSLGCTVVEMMTGKRPWMNLDNQWSAMFTIAKTEEGPPRPKGCSDSALDFLNLCLK